MKRIVAFLLVLAVTFTLCACGARNNEAKFSTESNENVIVPECVIPDTYNTSSDSSDFSLSSNNEKNCEPTEKAISVEKLTYCGKSGGSDKFTATVKNNTENVAYVLTITFTILDEDGTILGTCTRNAQATVLPGQGVVIDGFSTIGDAAGKYLSVSDFRYQRSDNVWVEGLVTMNTEILKIE